MLPLGLLVGRDRHGAFCLVTRALQQGSREIGRCARAATHVGGNHACVRSLKHALQVMPPRGRRLRCPARRSCLRAYHPASFPGCKLQPGAAR